MPVPGFQEMFVPFLQVLADGQPHPGQEVRQAIISHFSLSPEVCEEVLPSGRQTRLNNRIGWARTHLKNAGLIHYIRRGVHQITERGKEYLEKHPDGITRKMLDDFPEHREWLSSSGDVTTNDQDSLSDAKDQQTPEEQIEQLVKTLNSQLAKDLLDKVSEMDPFQFEQVVIDLLFAMGYGGSRKEAASVTKKSNDEGIDGVINEDRLGLDVIYVQAKRWQGNVGRKEIQAFVGALAGKQATKGVFITTSDFVSGAIDYADAVAQKVILISGKRLSQLMVEYGIGVSIADTIQLKKIDHDYFNEEG